MSRFTRREFLKIGAAVASWLGLRTTPLGVEAASAAPVPIYVARNGTPVTNVQQVVAMAGGIQQFVGYDDVVVLKPNGQWPLQGYTHTECMKALIDVILDRPGGFVGEVIIAEHVHRSATATLGSSYCWNMSSGSNRINNWPDMNYFELVDDYHARGIPNVTAVPLLDSGVGDFVAVSGPGDLSAGQHGWVRTTYTAPANGRTCRLSHPILRSACSGDLIDLQNGVWSGGDYNGRQVKLIFLPTLNNHGSFNHEDYAGPTSALKCHLGIVEFAGSGGYNLHGVGYNSPISPQAMGETVGHLITQVISPTFYLTCAEYTGYRSRTDSTAAHTRTVGLCADPATLDYWMCKHVMYPCANQTFMNPDNDNHLRQALVGCTSMGVGTIEESEMEVHIWDLDLDEKVYLPLVLRDF
jgi:hypothetical protein